MKTGDFGTVLSIYPPTFWTIASTEGENLHLTNVDGETLTVDQSDFWVLLDDLTS